MKIQKFGIEIRSIGSAKDLYNEVDMVLKKYNIQSGQINANIQVQTVAHALQDMIAYKDWFSICTIQSCAQLCGIRIPQERLDVYQSVHCIHWSKMLPDYR
jgi:hypothetical protein